MAIERFLRKAKHIQEEAKQRKAEEHTQHAAEDESNWLVSYADMMTLLAAFFVMMFSMSSLDKPKFEKLREEVSKQMGGKYESPSGEMAKFVTQIINELGLEKKAVVSADPTGVSIIFHSTLFFDTLSSQVKEPGQHVLNRLIEGIRKWQTQNLTQYKIVVEGHTDSRPILGGIYPTNWELSSARASQVVRMFSNQGFESKKLLPIGYGDTRPKYPERTPAGTWDEANLAANRRVVVRILDPQVETIPWDATSQSEAPTPPAETPAAAAVPPAPPVAAPAPATNAH